MRGKCWTWCKILLQKVYLFIHWFLWIKIRAVKEDERGMQGRLIALILQYFA